MGGKNSQPVRKVKHFYFGDVTKKKSFNKDVICVVRPIIDRGEFDDWKEKFDIVNDMNKENLLVPLGYDYRKIQSSKLTCGGCCGAEAEYQMTYDDVDFTLYSEIANRKQKKRYYSEPQLLSLFYQLLQGAKQFQKKDLRVGDIRTKNILVTKNGEVKMVNVASFPAQRTPIQKVLDEFDGTTKFYFAPQEIEYVKSNAMTSDKEEYPNPKTQAWSIGLCLLEAATLQSSEQLYSTNPRKFKEAQFEKRLKKVSQKFKTLYDFLSTVLKIDSSQRMSSGECWASMRPYGEKITQLQNFKRDPSKENASIRKFQTDGSGRK